MIPHFPEPILCHIIWRLGIFNQMKTAGCLGCYSTASPRSSITTRTRMGESGGSGTGKLQTRLFGGMFGIRSPWAREKATTMGAIWQLPRNISSTYLKQDSWSEWALMPAAGTHLCRGPRRRVCAWGCTFFEGKATELSLVASAISWRWMPHSCKQGVLVTEKWNTFINTEPLLCTFSNHSDLLPRGQPHKQFSLQAKRIQERRPRPKRHLQPRASVCSSAAKGWLAAEPRSPELR